ncbi:sulfite exporter TauE/SafE family protein [Kangiella sp. TOML190]|uniref:sulfite exporter TauE/SafE family protein n=1 Tax=Kangiella sp. TOML190 TaxID=2931351 RepID=UPI002041B2F6|nr:sulfite exporter TauE/SafE family protein [Kangiella sp. TOML190]
MLLEWHFIILLIALGLFNGILAGLLGIGGGLVIVPAMIWLLPTIGVPAEHLMHMALATSMATICFTAISSAYAHHQRGSVSISLLKLLVPAIAAGGLLGAYIANLIDTLWLGRIFGVAAVLMGLQMVVGKQPTAKGLKLNAVNAAPAGLGMGAISSLLGIGGGSVVVPYLLYHKEKLVMAIGTAAACGLPLAIMATIGYVVLGWQVSNLPPYHWGYVYLPAVFAIAFGSILSAPLGAYLAHKLPTLIIKRIFALLMVVVGAKIIMNNL